MSIRRMLQAAAASLAAAALAATGTAVPAQAADHRVTAGELTTLDASWYFLANVWSGMNVSVSQGSTANGAPFIQWPERRGTNGLPAGYQAFTAQLITGTWYAYRVASTANWYALAIPGGSTAAGVQAIQWNFEAAPTHNYEQQWEIEPYGGTGNFQLKNRKSDKCLAVKDTTQGTAIVQQACTLTDKQLFYLYS